MARTVFTATSALSRRQLLRLSGAAALGVLVGARRPAGIPQKAASSTVAAAPWGRIEQLAEGIWAVVSTPLERDDWTTLCNGGIVSGRHRVLVIESFAQAAGARAVAEQARELSGRQPTDVLITHYHGDHANGLEGFAAEDSRPVVWMTATTQKLIQEADSQRDGASDPRRLEMLQSARLLDPANTLVQDLGGREVVFYPRRGHTASDVTLEVAEPSIVFCGDLVWNQVFPNYRDTLPSALSESVRSLHRETATTYVPGHGSLAANDDLAEFESLIDAVEAAARRAIERGVPVAEAAAGFLLPESLRDWHRFRENYFEVAIGSWYKELGIGPQWSS
jgi:glyoxylase-like metal-dependent hydrolase (beta-lactamase superfamily II)